MKVIFLKFGHFSFVNQFLVSLRGLQSNWNQYQRPFITMQFFTQFVEHPGFLSGMPAQARLASLRSGLDFANLKCRGYLVTI